MAPLLVTLNGLEGHLLFETVLNLIPWEI